MEQILSQIASRKLTGITRQQAFNWCAFIALAVIALQVAYSHLSATLAFFGEHLYMVSYAAALMVSMVGFHWAKRHNSTTVGHIAAFVNGALLFVFAACVFVDGHFRFVDPEPIVVPSVVTIALVGLLVTLVTGYILGASGIETLNAKSAFAHIVASTMLSVATILGTLVTAFIGWAYIDAILSAVVAFVAAQWALRIIVDANRALTAPA